MAEFDAEKFKLQMLQLNLTDLISAVRETLVEIERVYGPPVPYRPAVALLFDETPIKDLALSARIGHCLHNEGIETVGQLSGKSDGDLLRIPNFGRKSLFELSWVISEHRKASEAATASSEHRKASGDE
jgi:DNA-directed RNA polymerase alpha subunit